MWKRRFMVNCITLVFSVFGEINNCYIIDKYCVLRMFYEGETNVIK